MLGYMPIKVFLLYMALNLEFLSDNHDILRSNVAHHNAYIHKNSLIYSIIWQSEWNENILREIYTVYTAGLCRWALTSQWAKRVGQEATVYCDYFTRIYSLATTALTGVGA